jgi:hypothetical protein
VVRGVPPDGATLEVDKIYRRAEEIPSGMAHFDADAEPYAADSDFETVTAV